MRASSGQQPDLHEYSGDIIAMAAITFLHCPAPAGIRLRLQRNQN